VQKLRKILTLMFIMLLVGCSSTGIGGMFAVPVAPASDDPPNSTAAAHQKHAELIVFAAASLTGAMQEIGNQFEAANPGVVVSFSFAGSQILRTQLEQGASADVFASADHKNMEALVAGGLVSSVAVRDFASNQLVVILPKGNPGGIQQLKDLAEPGVKVILADASVPAGNYARQALEKISNDPSYGVDFSQKVLDNVVSNETDVKQVVAKVELGEADAGIVYTSDAVASPELQTIPIPDQLDVTANYPIAALSLAREPEIARAFVDYVLSPAGQAILEKWGFGGVTPRR
jgi:molybdate transport system substrate-binding protein